MEALSCHPGDDDETRARKANFTLAILGVIPAGILWGVIYLAVDARLAALVPLGYSLISTANLMLLRGTRNFPLFQNVSLVLILGLPFLLQWNLGGFINGSVVVVWSFFAPLLAVLFLTRRATLSWFSSFALLVVVSAFAPLPSRSLPDWFVATMFVLNLTTVSALVFSILVSFMTGRRRLRELERAYLDQTVMLRQREKLATLGTLAAGVAHELNNPAAAVRSAAHQLPPALTDLCAAVLAATGSYPQAHQATALAALLTGPAPASGPVSGLERATLEEDIEAWLYQHHVGQPWEVASTLLAAGYRRDDLETLADDFDDGQITGVVSMLAMGVATRGLAVEIAEASDRISTIVSALRSYSYLDRGDLQSIDVTEGIESTLVLLRAKVSEMKVIRNYHPDLPRILARGSELNQVWTNIIDNAVDATAGTGQLQIRTTSFGGGVVVEFEDDGVGMPEGVVGRVFDPFFTTKAPGKGTGLGLNISHNIIVLQHGGQISVDSRPGQTVFRVELPAVATASGESRD
jgi:signal transduction histidine kinase